MFRTVLTAFALGFATSSAPVDQFPHSPMGLVVQGHDGSALGRVTAVERNADGEITAVEIPGLEPPDAPSSEFVAEDSSLQEPRRIIRIEGASG